MRGRWPLVLAACSVGSAVAVYLAARPERDRVADPAFVVTPAEVDLGLVPLGTRVVAFEVTNPADRPRRIIGLAEM